MFIGIIWKSIVHITKCLSDVRCVSAAHICGANHSKSLAIDRFIAVFGSSFLFLFFSFSLSLTLLLLAHATYFVSIFAWNQFFGHFRQCIYNNVFLFSDSAFVQCYLIYGFYHAWHVWDDAVWCAFIATHSPLERTKGSPIRWTRDFVCLSSLPAIFHSFFKYPKGLSLCAKEYEALPHHSQCLSWRLIPENLPILL